jgi:hypothetical protein
VTTVSPKRVPRRHKLLTEQLDVLQITPEARKQAAAVLEVLAGLRTPEQAAEALSVSLPTYYNLETRALRGLFQGCLPQPPGRSMVLGAKLRAAELRCVTLEKQVQRYQALLRTAQRNVGLMPATTPAKAEGKRRRRRKPTVRALRALAALRENGITPAESVGPSSGEGLSPSTAVSS